MPRELCVILMVPLHSTNHRAECARVCVKISDQVEGKQKYHCPIDKLQAFNIFIQRSKPTVLLWCETEQNSHNER